MQQELLGDDELAHPIDGNAAWQQRAWQQCAWQQCGAVTLTPSLLRLHECHRRSFIAV
jgi:hypothetical protein